MRTTSKVTSKGRVTIPQEVRLRMGLRPGDEVEFVEDTRGFRMRKRLLDSPLRKYLGYLVNFRGKDPDAVVGAMGGH